MTRTKTKLKTIPLTKEEKEIIATTEYIGLVATLNASISLRICKIFDKEEDNEDLARRYGRALFKLLAEEKLSNQV